jgi:dTDP-4-dehydrorhamnose reductase
VKVLTDDPARSGLYHFAGAPDTSWADFAREIFSQSGRQVDVVDIGTAEYPTRAVRPLNSRLDCGMLDRLGLTPPDWKSDLGDVLKELKAQDDKS